MNDDQDDKVDYLNSPEIGSIGNNMMEGFKAPNMERPSTGISGIKSPPYKIAPIDNTLALSSVRAELAAKSKKIPFHVNEENFNATAQMMKDNEEEDERTYKPVSIQKNVISATLGVTSKIASSILKRK